MRTTIARIILSLSLLLVLSGLTGVALSADFPKLTKTSPTVTPPAPPVRTVMLIKVDAPITPVVAEYIIKSIDTAEKDNAEAIIIQLNTPGGLVDSTNEIIMKMMSSAVPTVVYVAPSGGRAASAGVFITLASNIAAMAPTTHIGAASPVQMQGQMDKTMAKKVTNDLAAMIRGIAEKRGRNAKWAEEAVRKAVSITETEALKIKVIEIIAPDIDSLVKQIDGRTVDVVLGKKDAQDRRRDREGTPHGVPLQAPRHHQQPEHRLHPHDPGLLRTLLRALESRAPFSPA